MYADSMAEFGTPCRLNSCEGWVLIRNIRGFPYQDAVGCYPIFACSNWAKLHLDLENIGNDLVTISLVADPFGKYDIACLHKCFKDRVIPFKEHFVTQLSRPQNAYISDHHRRYARKSLKKIHVEKCDNPSDFVDDWIVLYANLIKRHKIKGITAFSRDSFEKQLRVPGIFAFRAMYEYITIGMLLWYVHNDVAYYHLGAYSDRGYDLRASFALVWFAIKYFASSGLQWLDLGAGAGINSDGSDGLSRFKRGWSTGIRTAYFCGRIFHKTAYDEIVAAKKIANTNYFPAYRKGEYL